MKLCTLIAVSVAGYASAAPAIVWKGSKDVSRPVKHSSKRVNAASLMANAAEGTQDGSLATIFLINRDEDGTESFSKIASNGGLPGVESKYDEATHVHSHVAGIESSIAMSRYPGALRVTLSEFSSKLASPVGNVAEMEVSHDGMASKTTKRTNSRARALAKANILVVDIPASAKPQDIDTAVTNAIEHESVSSVVLAGIRSTQEVKDERANLAQRRNLLQREAGRSLQTDRRRLEDEAQDEDDENNNNNQNNNNNDLTGVYYVHMTPNIFAGILFTILFAFVAWTGISCMGMIAGQDVFVQKMPTIGREA
eukprot:CAMPEP_0194046516 /NCGR_PEP_ID=MMETSP0009_2-20130614/21410_1 /TAXON_ID=210454 /ORGANISM="Grammatophora oceanica, Strain CCMP 410" /LENGTH=310 /DNA_ID=CAMNT_0038691835 /DNA_START=59 /DNA_END=991 /DNA_ORIENTATION=+